MTINLNLAYVSIAMLSGLAGFLVGWMCRPAKIIIDSEVILAAAESLLDD